MKLLKNISLLSLLLFMGCTGIAQRQTFDVVTYTPPKDWTEKQADGNISYSRIDGGSWAQIAIYNHRNSEGSIQADFDKDWNELVAVGRTISAPEKTEPKQSGDWTVMSGSGVWQYNGANVASMLTVYSNQKICVTLLCNSTAMPYLKTYQQLIASLDIVATNNAEAATTENNASPQPNTTTATGVSNSSIVGLWCNNILETSGYMNGIPMYTAGYSRREYAFYGDGTYLFRTKIWWTTVKDILWVYESGTYTINGDQLTITPLKGKGEYWSKINSSTKEWGKLVRSSAFVLEKVSYRFNVKYFSGSKNYDLNLIPLHETQRDGGLSPTEGYHYILRETGVSLIDNPPGFKTGFENRPFTTAAPSPANNTVPANAANAMLSGKIWEGISAEKFSGGPMNGYNTGGFDAMQYAFHTDGTYRFVNVRASHYTDTKTLQYETGNYLLNGNQLTINPAKGQNEEWSKIGKTTNGNSDVANRAINETWGKKLRASPRKLESYAYTCSIEKNGNKAALVLQRSIHTEREGEGSISYFNETTADRSVTLPATIK